MANGSGNGNGRTLLQWWPLIVSMLGVAVAFGFLKADVQHLDKEIDTKASVELVNTQYMSILRELDNLRGDLKLQGGQP